MVGRSQAIQHVFSVALKVSRFDSTVLITGESGTGKELVAQGIHQESDRRSGPMVPVNCASIPESLIESELFGHVKGAFTGAEKIRRAFSRSQKEAPYFSTRSVIFQCPCNPNCFGFFRRAKSVR
jgi:transcriptional regulator with PAS, ATPase and Fis domain